MLQPTLPIPGINRIHESPRLTEFKRVRQQFRFLMSSLLGADEDDINKAWDWILDVFDIPVKEWGKYPSDKVVDGNYSTEDLEYYTHCYDTASDFLVPKCHDKRDCEEDDEWLAHFWEHFFVDLGFQTIIEREGVGNGPETV